MISLQFGASIVQSMKVSSTTNVDGIKLKASLLARLRFCNEGKIIPPLIFIKTFFRSHPAG